MTKKGSVRIVKGEESKCLPIECTSYNVSGDATRRVNSGKGDLCDRDMVGWVRFVDRAGTAIVRKAPNGRCGSVKAGWILGVYPREPGTTSLSTLCYVDEIGNPCSSSKAIRSTHCGDFLVFEIPHPPNCPARACTDDYELH
ncbi:unnamed protein product [Rotaria sp. Silwood2]|nr:unnamed protein product [Rotaria sp. Silwood2]